MHLLTIALVAGASLRRYGRDTSLRSRRAYPELQHGDTYETDFVHDDTEHPAQAVEVNIKESDEKVRDTQARMKDLEGKLNAAKAAAASATKAHEADVAETEHAAEMVAKYNASLHGSDAIKADLETANANLATAMDALNTTDIESSASAEGIKAAEEDFHGATLKVVEAKENVTVADDVVADYTAKVEKAKVANVSFSEWTQKLNESQLGADDLVATLSAYKAEYDKVHEHSEVAEARLSEAQKLFDVDKESYESLVGPYTPPGGAKPDDDEWQWWDVTTWSR